MFAAVKSYLMFNYYFVNWYCCFSRERNLFKCSWFPRWSVMGSACGSVVPVISQCGTINTCSQVLLHIFSVVSLINQASETLNISLARCSCSVRTLLHILCYVSAWVNIVESALAIECWSWLSCHPQSSFSDSNLQNITWRGTMEIDLNLVFWKIILLTKDCSAMDY